MTPHFAIGEGYAVYRGPTTTGDVHRHAAFQIVIGQPDAVGVADAAGVTHRAVALVVSPMYPHCLQATPAVLAFFVEPHCAFADSLRRNYGDGVSAAPELRNLREADVQPVGSRESEELDPRLVQALNALANNAIELPAVAAQVGLSPQRLRALAREQLGMPLTRWRMWTHLRHAAEALQSGRTLADAATAAGFADQAHFSRRMREMMGLTPAALLPIVRSQSLRAT